MRKRGSPMAGSFRPVERIVVPVQGSDREFLAQSWAIELAASLGLPVYAVHVVEDPDAETSGTFAYLRGEAAKWQVAIDTTVLDGPDAATEILAELTPRDLVVLGTSRLSGKYHVGSVALELVRRSPCPVQIVRLE